jgi:hypothetical protein
MVSGGEQDELRRLRREITRLKDLLTRHGIAWEEPTAPAEVSADFVADPFRMRAVDGKISPQRIDPMSSDPASFPGPKN